MQNEWNKTNSDYESIREFFFLVDILGLVAPVLATEVMECRQLDNQLPMELDLQKRRMELGCLE